MFRTKSAMLQQCNIPTGPTCMHAVRNEIINTAWWQCWESSTLVLTPNCTKVSWPSLNQFLRGFQHLVQKLCGQNQTAFYFQQVIHFATTLHFVKLGMKHKCPFWTSLQPWKSSEIKSLAFLLQPICHLPGRFYEYWLASLGDTVSKKIKISPVRGLTVDF